jgi:hypothetical protein
MLGRRQPGNRKDESQHRGQTETRGSYYGWPRYLLDGERSKKVQTANDPMAWPGRVMAFFLAGGRQRLVAAGASSGSCQPRLLATEPKYLYITT